MKYPLFAIFILFIITSCRYFETEKISSETYYEEELKMINWNDIDQYPTFTDCKDITEKPEQETCFVNVISERIHRSIDAKKLHSIHDLQDTIRIGLAVSNGGKLSVSNIEMDSMLQIEFPDLEKIIRLSVDSIALEAPAYKRGIPVSTEFILPVIFRTD